MKSTKVISTTSNFSMFTGAIRAIESVLKSDEPFNETLLFFAVKKVMPNLLNLKLDNAYIYITVVENSRPEKLKLRYGNFVNGKWFTDSELKRYSAPLKEKELNNALQQLQAKFARI